jgi:hypothetical protein
VESGNGAMKQAREDRLSQLCLIDARKRRDKMKCIQVCGNHKDGKIILEYPDRPNKLLCANNERIQSGESQKMDDNNINCQDVAKTQLCLVLVI